MEAGLKNSTDKHKYRSEYGLSDIVMSKIRAAVTLIVG
jgi:hypothetical protein